MYHFRPFHNNKHILSKKKNRMPFSNRLLWFSMLFMNVTTPLILFSWNKLYNKIPTIIFTGCLLFGGNSQIVVSIEITERIEITRRCFSKTGARRMYSVYWKITQLLRILCIVQRNSTKSIHPKFGWIKNAQTSRIYFWGRHISYIFSTYASNLQRRSIITLKFRWKKSEKIHPMEHHWIILQLILCSSSSLQQLMKEGLHQHWPLWITTIVTFIVNLLIFNKKVYLKTDIDVKYRQVHHLKSVMGYNVCWS